MTKGNNFTFKINHFDDHLNVLWKPNDRNIYSWFQKVMLSQIVYVMFIIN